MTDLLLAVTFVSALCCGLNAGVFFAFSAFVMKGLARLPPAQGIAAMQAINVAAVTPLFMTALFGTAAVCLLLVVYAWWVFPQSGVVYLTVGGLLYVVGTALVTVVFNVPRNDTLAALDPEGDGSARVWADYVRGWTAWNHVRALAALAASATLTFAMLR